MSLRAVAITTVALQATIILVTGAALTNQARKVRQHEACLASVKPGARADLDPAKLCAPAIAKVHAVAVRAGACDAALTTRPENTYGVAASCSTPVKTLQTERDVARREADRLTTDLQNERLDRDGAISRASAAATTQAERIARAAAALKAAPRDGDGLAVCDAECVRYRWTAVLDERRRPDH